MHPNYEVATLINRTECLYLRELSEPSDNQLNIWIEEASTNEAKRGSFSTERHPPELQYLLRGAAPIESSSESRMFRLFWKRYAAYLVTEECVGSCGSYDDEVYEGRLFWLYLKSHFLEHLDRDTGAHSNPLIHYKICCLNHTIDVAADAPPEIEVLKPDVRSKPHD